MSIDLHRSSFSLPGPVLPTGCARVLSLAAALLLTAPTQASSVVFTTSSVPIVINHFANATPYPSNMGVASISLAPVSKITVRINGFSHTYSSDVDVYLQAPNGKYIVLFSDVGRNFTAVDLDFIFTDDAVAVLPENAQLVSGTYRPDPGSDSGSETFPPEADRVNTLLELAAGGIDR